MRRYRRNQDCAGRIVDGLGFVITPDDNRLHALNGPATALWKLAQDEISLADATSALVSMFEVDETTARVDALECLEDLVKRQILVAVER
jgi:hypothetical protein